ncbi:hypothetical protein TNCV_2658741 [Trichonephila clavipes]|nr:hypothetical protein TNCV_2658741 [Trichonephila clavipes]
MENIRASLQSQVLGSQQDVTKDCKTITFKPSRIRTPRDSGEGLFARWPAVVVWKEGSSGVVRYLRPSLRPVSLDQDLKLRGQSPMSPPAAL